MGSTLRSIFHINFFSLMWEIRRVIVGVCRTLVSDSGELGECFSISVATTRNFSIVGWANQAGQSFKGVEMIGHEVTKHHEASDN